MLPNLSSLSLATGRLQNANAWLFVQRLKKNEPSRDPITTEDWRADVRKEEGDGPAPKYGWILEVDAGDGKRTPEPGYLYDVEALAQHLLNGGTSPLSRLPAHDDDKKACIDKANAIRRAKRLPELKRMSPEALPESELPPLPALSRAAAREHGRNVPEAEANGLSAAFREAREIVWARRAEERARQANEARLEEIPLVGWVRPRTQAETAARNRRRETRQRWRGTDYPELPDDVRAGLEDWLRVLPEDDVQSFIVYAGEALRVPNIVNDEMLTWTMDRLLMRLDWLIQEANAVLVVRRPAAERIPGWADSMQSFTDFVGRGRGIHRGRDQDAMTEWVDYLWQMVGAWTRRRATTPDPPPPRQWGHHERAQRAEEAAAVARQDAVARGANALEARRAADAERERVFWLPPPWLHRDS